MNKLVVAPVLLTVLTVGLSGGASAQTATPAPTTASPRVEQVDQRLQKQQEAIDAGVASGKINPEQAAKDKARDARVSNELSKDEAKNGGHITKAEQIRMNKKLTKNSHKIHRQMNKSVVAAPVTPVQ